MASLVALGAINRAPTARRRCSTPRPQVR